MQSAATLPGVLVESEVRYFSAHGCVDYSNPAESYVFIGGNLIGAFAPEDYIERDVLIAFVSQDKAVKYGRVADAFQVSYETVRLVRRRYEKGGVSAVIDRRRRGRPRVQTPELEQELFELFGEGMNIPEAHKSIEGRVSLSVVSRVHIKWREERQSCCSQPRSQEPEPEPCQQSLAGIAEPLQQPVDEPAAEDEQDKAAAGEPEPPAQPERNDNAKQQPTASDELELEAAIADGGSRVQHIGTWIMLAMLNSLGLYALAERLRAKAESDKRDAGKTFVGAVTLRAAIDAVVCALSIGKRCVEGVRWLETQSGPTLLRRTQTISASWSRRVLARFATESSTEFHWGQATSLANQATEDDERAVFYIDGHVRPYTGKHTTRKAWRMQTKKASPGVSDYYLHDEQGRPLMRIADPTNGTLTDWLLPIGQLIREALGGNTKVLLAFDRAGAYAEHMAELRDDKLEFVTYERAPYKLLPNREFKHKRWQQIGRKRIRFVELARKNLGKGRGRVRRIYVQTKNGEQLSVLAVSDAPAKVLLEVLFCRWSRQENKFKHDNERWGTNQLDGRQVQDTPADEVIPNPARRRLDREIRIVRAAEGQARRKLAQLAEDHPKRQRYEEDLENALERQREILALRPEVPTHAPVGETELAGELVHHPGHYKLVIDTLRIACANAESDLAVWLGSQMPRPAEAKKALAKLFAAPGVVRPNRKSITVTLEPAGTPTELQAYRALMSLLNTLALQLPGDPSGRHLRFKLQNY
jgi:transposase